MILGIKTNPSMFPETNAHPSMTKDNDGINAPFRIQDKL